MATTENPLTVMTRESMRRLRVDAEDETRVRQINHIIKTVYSSAICKANTTSETSDHCELQNIPLGLGYGEKRLIFDTRDKEEIRQGLRRLFPDCSIEYKNLIHNTFDGKFVDVSTIDPQVLQQNRGRVRECIVIDWT
jgi:hypothetical protein